MVPGKDEHIRCKTKTVYSAATEPLEDLEHEDPVAKGTLEPACITICAKPSGNKKCKLYIPTTSIKFVQLIPYHPLDIKLQDTFILLLSL